MLLHARQPAPSLTLPRTAEGKPPFDGTRVQNEITDNVRSSIDGTDSMDGDYVRVLYPGNGSGLGQKAFAQQRVAVRQVQKPDGDGSIKHRVLAHTQ